MRWTLFNSHKMSVPTSNDMNVMLTKKMNENLGIYVDFEDNLSRSFHVYCAKTSTLTCNLQEE